MSTLASPLCRKGPFPAPGCTGTADGAGETHGGLASASASAPAVHGLPALILLRTPRGGRPTSRLFTITSWLPPRAAPPPNVAPGHVGRLSRPGEVPGGGDSHLFPYSQCPGALTC